MKKKELTSSEVSAVPCPTCEADVGEPCRIYSGRKRHTPHVERKFAAIAVLENKVPANVVP
jgi:hypothetical protein